MNILHTSPLFSYSLLFLELVLARISTVSYHLVLSSFFCMMKNTELAEAIRGLQSQTDSLTSQQTEVLRALSEHTETMKSLQK